MITEVAMPVLGLTMEHGTIVAWLKEVGDRVEAGEPLFMVETDKATSDAPSPVGGLLAAVLCEEGDTVAVGAVVALVAETAEEAEQARARNATPLKETGPMAGVPEVGSDAGAPATATDVMGPETGPAPAVPGGRAASPLDDADGARPGIEPAAPDGRVFASPRARARARALGIDLAAAAPHDGRLTERDVLALAAGNTGSRPAPVPLASPGVSASGVTPTAGPAASGGESGKIVKLSRTRKIIAERMTLSATTVPQVTYTLRCDVTEAMALRRSLKAGGGDKRLAVSLDALIVRAAALALTDFPGVNSQWIEGRGIRIVPEVNIAFAVDLEDDGLVIPVVHGADRMGIRETAVEIDRLVAGARSGKLGPDDYAGATFTITSLASLGVETFTPIIVPPQAAILGVGAIVSAPVFAKDQVVKRRMLALCLTTDHRILDGGPSARFLSRVRDLLEQPAVLSRT